MESFLTTLHLLSCISLIVVVLLQRGKGSDMGAMLGGGGSQTVFGARGAGNFLTKLTTGCAVIFMGTSLWLAFIATQTADTQIFDATEIEEPAEGAAAGALEDLAEEAQATGVGALEEIEDAAVGTLEEIDAPPAAGEEPAESPAANP